MLERKAEGRHLSGAEAEWVEWWSFEFADTTGRTGGNVQLGLMPGGQRAWWWCHLLGFDRRLVVVRDDEVRLPRTRALELRSEGLWAELVCETPHEHWSLGMEAFGVALDRPTDAYFGERGERIPVGLDLEWELTRPPVEEALPVECYGQAGSMRGEVLLGRDRFPIEAWGHREHGWGPATWWSRPWTRAVGHFGGGTIFRAFGFGAGAAEQTSCWLDRPGDSAEEPVRNARFSVDTRLGTEGLPSEAVVELGGAQLRVWPLAYAPLERAAALGAAGRLVRALCDFEGEDGRRGRGWCEWNQPAP